LFVKKSRHGLPPEVFRGVFELSLFRNAKKRNKEKPQVVGGWVSVAFYNPTPWILFWVPLALVLALEFLHIWPYVIFGFVFSGLYIIARRRRSRGTIKRGRAKLAVTAERSLVAGSVGL
jgi:hypothetical protein